MNKQASRYSRNRRIYVVLFFFSALPALMLGGLFVLTIWPPDSADLTSGPSRVTLGGAGVFCLTSLVTLIGFLVTTIRLSRLKGKRADRLRSDRLAEWRKVLDKRFGMSELKTLCFDMGIDYEDLPGATKADKAAALLRHVHRDRRLADLAKVGAQLRPDIAWDDLPKDDKH